MKIKPVYRFESLILLGLDIDYVENKVLDGLVVELNLERKSLRHGPWSLQKKLKFGFYYPVEKSEEAELTELIYSVIPVDDINEFIELLLHPEDESVKSLIWLPERLRKQSQ